MSPGATEQLNRIVQLVADVSRDPQGSRGVPIGELAARLGTTEPQVRQDLRTLTAISDEPGAEWLQSLSVWQEGDRVAAVSRGPYRRPLRFTPDELLAIRVGLALEGAAGETLAGRIGAALAMSEGEAQVRLSGAADGEAGVIAVMRDAMDRGRAVCIKYAGERDRLGRERLIEPHQVVSTDGRHYVVAFCRQEGGWRHFRVDRVLDVHVDEAPFTPRADFTPVTDPSEVFRSESGGDDVTVRYSPAVARWLGERFPDAPRLADGSIEVTYCVVEPTWLVRMVLQYGADAEVISPDWHRDNVLRALTGGL